ncbi:MAG: hypothetical protein ABA06_04720 [Parcubacteria bacterium C7867-001]|nr:MAG: hypothetical protein ABA06_04720 [Parcubacteria bacterium C7867-001]
MSFLRQLNELPFPLTISHYHKFASGFRKEKLKDGKLDSPESWDALREQEPSFSIAETREEWLKAAELSVKKDGQDANLGARAADIVPLLKRHAITTIFSVGAGGGGLEYQLKKRIPELRIVASEYAPKSVELLRKVFLEAEEVRSFDLLSGDWTPVTERIDAATTLVLIYRLDAQFTDRQWRDLFKTLATAGVSRVLYIPTGFLTLRSLFFRLSRRIAWLFSGAEMVFAGYLRTKTTFHSFWKGSYQSEEGVFGGSGGFWLTRR